MNWKSLQMEMKIEHFKKTCKIVPEWLVEEAQKRILELRFAKCPQNECKCNDFKESCKITKILNISKYIAKKIKFKSYK